MAAQSCSCAVILLYLARVEGQTRGGDAAGIPAASLALRGESGLSVLPDVVGKMM